MINSTQFYILADITCEDWNKNTIYNIVHFAQSREDCEQYIRDNFGEFSKSNKRWELIKALVVPKTSKKGFRKFTIIEPTHK